MVDFSEHDSVYAYVQPVPVDTRSRFNVNKEILAQLSYDIVSTLTRRRVSTGLEF